MQSCISRSVATKTQPSPNPFLTPADELETLALGQALDLHWKFQKKCPTTSEYLNMVDNKTGGLFRMALRVMEIESKTEPCPDLMHLITLMGRYYQIRDDYMNLTSDEVCAWNSLGLKRVLTWNSIPKPKATARTSRRANSPSR